MSSALDPGRSICLCALAGALFLFSFAHAEAATTEEEVREYFADTPVMIAIAECESKFKQYTSNGSALYGGWGGGMVGVFQIFENIHAAGASKLGFDITTLEGNLGYAKHLYSQQGTTPWNSSKSCWQNKEITMPVKKSSKETTKKKDVEELEKKVAELEKLVKKLKRLLAQKRAV